MSRLRKHYKNRVIEATASPLQGGGFSVQVSIEDHRHEHVDVTELYSAGQTFKTDVAALEAGLKLGQQKVDMGGGLNK